MDQMIMGPRPSIASPGAIVCLRVLLILLASLHWSCRGQSEEAASAPWDRLCHLEGVRLDRLEMEQKEATQRDILSIVTRAFPGPEASGFTGTPAMFIRLREHARGACWVLLFLEPVRKSPGAARARALLFDDNGVGQGDEIFNCGWRHDSFVDLKKISVPGSLNCISISSQMTVGPSPETLYLAISRKRLVLVRLEGDGQFLRNDYSYPNHTVGPLHVPSNVEESLEELHSADPARVLALLVWIGGTHWTGDRLDLQHEDPAQSDLANHVIREHRISECLATLTRSPNAWIAESALHCRSD
jgi:hypothetical protein